MFHILCLLIILRCDSKFEAIWLISILFIFVFFEKIKIIKVYN